MKFVLYREDPLHFLFHALHIGGGIDERTPLRLVSQPNHAALDERLEKKRKRRPVSRTYFLENFFYFSYSVNVNGMVTTVFPDEILLKVHLFTAPFISLSKSLKSVVDDSITIFVISPLDAIANFKTTFP